MDVDNDPGPALVQVLAIGAPQDCTITRMEQLAKEALGANGFQEEVERVERLGPSSAAVIDGSLQPAGIEPDAPAFRILVSSSKAAVALCAEPRDCDGVRMLFLLAPDAIAASTGRTSSSSARPAAATGRTLCLGPFSDPAGLADGPLMTFFARYAATQVVAIDRFFGMVHVRFKATVASNVLGVLVREEPACVAADSGSVTLAWEGETVPIAEPLPDAERAFWELFRLRAARRQQSLFYILSARAAVAPPAAARGHFIVRRSARRARVASASRKPARGVRKAKRPTRNGPLRAGARASENLVHSLKEALEALTPS